MADPASLAQTIIPAVTGLVGVLAGAWITLWRERSKEERERTGDAKYLAVLVSAHLSRIASQCRGCAMDTGLDDFGNPPADSELKPLQAAPVFEPLKIEVNWKSLDAALMADILDLPHRLNAAKREARYFMDNDPPHYSRRYFIYRRYSYAKLAVHVVQLASRLRKQVGYEYQLSDTQGDDEIKTQAVYEIVEKHFNFFTKRDILASAVDRFGKHATPY